MIVRNFIVEEIDAGKRVDVFLTENLDLSRSKIQKLVKDGSVLINEETTTNNYRLEESDEIFISYAMESEPTVEPEDIALDIVYEDDNIIVVNKPRGMVTHPAVGNYSHTLVNALVYHCNRLSEVNGYLRPGIVHRLDKDTSGLLVVAKDDKSHLNLQKQLADRRCHRHYYALVDGIIDYDEFRVDAPIGRNPNNRQMMCVTDKNSKEAITDFKVLERFKDSCLLDCSLQTGRTHQIRVHAKYINHPVINDPKYSRRIIDESGQILHAYQLEFIHPVTGKEMCFTTEMPEYMKEMIERIR
jgi:23S rRNA pseudouridine1911/1915/1917 synthase